MTRHWRCGAIHCSCRPFGRGLRIGNQLDVATFELADRREIAIVIGEPPNAIPSRFPPGVE
jgi:hypothetical protein